MAVMSSYSVRWAPSCRSRCSVVHSPLWGFRLLAFFPIHPHPGAGGPAHSCLSSPAVFLQWFLFQQFFFLVMPRMIQSRVVLLLPPDILALWAPFSPRCFALEVPACAAGLWSPGWPP